MPGSHNTHRWIRFGDFFTFQPSEIAKPVLVLFLAWFLSTRLDKMRDENTLARAILIPVVFVILIVRQPDWNRAGAGRVTAMMLFLAGMNWKYWPASSAHPALFGCAGSSGCPGRWATHHGLSSSQLRCKRWRGRGLSRLPIAYAVGTGGVAGRGYMEGRAETLFLPEATLTSSSPTS